MKKGKKIFAFLFAAMLFILSAGSVFAAENYSYTVTFYAGNRGTFTSLDGLIVESETAVVTHEEDRIIVSGIQPGEQVGLTAQASVTLEQGSKYYVQGIRLSGRDNDTVAESVFYVDSDIDYVVAYGIKGNQVSYTVNYQDAEGNALAPSDVYYGNIGDKPVVAYRYIDGYVPRYLGLTKTLSENDAENVFTFIYDKKVANEINTNVPRPGNDGNGDNDSNVGDNDGDEPGNQGGETPDNQDNTSENPGGDTDVIIDLDEEEVPLGDGQSGSIFDNLPMVFYVALGVVAVIALIVLFILSRRMKPEGKE